MEQTSKILVFLLVVFTFVAIRSTSANPAPRGSVPLRCMVREYTAYQAEKPGCRPQPLLVDACYGLCDTFQVSHQIRTNLAISIIFVKSTFKTLMGCFLITLCKKLCNNYECRSFF